MKCKVCGRELNPNKTNCEICGTPVPETLNYNGEFSWNTIDFPKPKKMEEIEMSWPDMNSAPKHDSFMTKDASEGFVPNAGNVAKEPKQEQPQAQVQMQPSAQQQASVQYVSPQFAWTMPSAPWTVPQPVQPVQPIQPVQPVYVAQPMPQVQPVYVQPIPAVQTTMQMPTLNINPMQNTMQMPAVQPAPVQTQAPVQQAPVQQAPVQTQNTIPSNPEVTSAPAAIKNPIDVDNWLDEQLKDSKPEDSQFFTFYKKNEDFQKLLDEEYENYKRKFDTNATSLKIPAQEIAAASVAASAAETEKKFDTIPLQPIQEAIAANVKADDKTMVYTAGAQHAYPKAAENSAEPAKDLFGEEPVTDFDKMIFEGTQNPDENDATLVITNEQLKKEIDEVAKKVEEACNQIEYDAEKRQKDLDDMAAARMAFLNKEQKEDLDKTSALEIKSIFDEWDRQRQEAEDQKNKKKKGGFGRFLLILLLLIALFVGADLAVVSFVDDSPIRDFFYNVNIEADKVVTKIEDRFSNLNFDFLHKDEKDPEPVVELTDQEKIIQACNTNIGTVTCDVEGSKYSKDGKYGYNNLGSCTIVTDEDIINAATEVLVKYNCAWIDYVNSGSDISCFDYLKADGEAFRLASSFEGVGKIKEEFKSLNIGEIRQDSKDIYVFADEDILVKNGSSTTEVPSRLVYRMTKVGDDYKIVEYDDYGGNN